MYPKTPLLIWVDDNIEDPKTTSYKLSHEAQDKGINVVSFTSTMTAKTWISKHMGLLWII